MVSHHQNINGTLHLMERENLKRGSRLIYKFVIYISCLFVLRFNVPVNNFSVMSGQSHRFLGITSTFGELSALLKDTTWQKYCTVCPDLSIPKLRVITVCLDR